MLPKVSSLPSAFSAPFDVRLFCHRHVNLLPAVVTDVCRPRRFPPWCGRAAMWGSWAAIALANGVSVWAGYGFNQNVAMMWLISCFSSFFCSFLLLEPIKVIAYLQGCYNSSLFLFFFILTYRHTQSHF